MATAFPLLRLPYPVLMFVLEQLEFRKRISLSFLSRRVRMFVKLLEMKCDHINLKLKYGTIVMEVWVDKQEELKLEMYTSGYVEFIYRHHISLCNTSGVPPMDYACWVMDVMHCKSIHQFRIAQLSHYNILPLLVSLPKINEVIAEETHNSSSPDPRLQKILKIVLPVSSAVTIPYHALKPEDLREIIRGNFDSVTVRKYSADYMPSPDMKYSLNDLKMTNVKSLELAGPAFTLEDLNRYFKLWMEKICNPRLEYLRVWQNGSVNKDLLLDELNSVQMPIRTNRKFKVLGNVTQLGSNEKIDFEFDITRVDGRTATIRISNYTTVSFYVWPESDNDTTNNEPNQSSFMSRFSYLSTFYNSFIERFK